MSVFVRLSESIPIDFTGLATAGDAMVWHRDGSPIWVGPNEELTEAIEVLGVTVPPHSGPHLRYTDAPELEHLFENLPWLEKKIVVHTVRAQAATRVRAVQDFVGPDADWHLDASANPISWLLPVGDPAHEVVLERIAPEGRVLVDAQALDILDACGEWAVPAWVQASLELEWEVVLGRLVELRDRKLLAADGPLDHLLQHHAGSTHADPRPARRRRQSPQPDPSPQLSDNVAAAPTGPHGAPGIAMPTGAAMSAESASVPADLPREPADTALQAAFHAVEAGTLTDGRPTTGSPDPNAVTQLPTRSPNDTPSTFEEKASDPPVIQRTADPVPRSNGTSFQARMSRLQRREALLRRAQAAQAGTSRAEALLRLVDGIRQHSDV
ncbi:hypothetical protein [Euzebya tangerina]|uniref:hypothetical protein n=1 Tax=Euzebya tangerina TaxID=591198 RepID=UPI000E30E3D1|nr:hypothetical protein [Euzebya tangerina]